MDNQIDGNKKEERSKLLIELSNKNEQEFMRKFLGHNMSVLFEQECNHKPGYFEGYTSNYMKVLVPFDCDSVAGKILDVKLEDIEGENIIGKME